MRPAALLHCSLFCHTVAYGLVGTPDQAPLHATDLLWPCMIFCGQARCVVAMHDLLWPCTMWCGAGSAGSRPAWHQQTSRKSAARTARGEGTDQPQGGCHAISRPPQELRYMSTLYLDSSRIQYRAVSLHPWSGHMLMLQLITPCQIAQAASCTRPIPLLTEQDLPSVSGRAPVMIRKIEVQLAVG